MERVAPRLEVAKLIMPAPHVGKFRQWQFRAFGERQRRRHPEISVGYPFSEEPRAMFEIFVEGSRVLPKSLEACSRIAGSGFSSVKVGATTR